MPITINILGQPMYDKETIETGTIFGDATTTHVFRPNWKSVTCCELFCLSYYCVLYVTFFIKSEIQSINYVMIWSWRERIRKIKIFKLNCLSMYKLNTCILLVPVTFFNYFVIKEIISEFAFMDFEFTLFVKIHKLIRVNIAKNYG